MPNPHPDDEAYARDVASFRAAQAELLAQLREQTADKPAHAAFLVRLLAVPTEDAALDLAGDALVLAGVSYAVAEALAEDVAWARFAEPPTPGWLASGAPRAYRKHRVKQARAAAVRDRTRQATAEAGFEAKLNAAIFGRR